MTAFDDWAKSPECLSKLHPVTLQEAFDAGMTRAAEICREIYKSKTISTLTETIKTVAIRECHDAIIKARDGGK